MKNRLNKITIAFLALGFLVLLFPMRTGIIKDKGKTAVANRMADILYKLGYIRKGHLITVTRDDLVGQYIGHTAPKTKEVLKQAMGGVLFIDEAYYLYKPDNERDYGAEAIEILLQVMENQSVPFYLYRVFANG